MRKWNFPIFTKRPPFLTFYEDFQGAQEHKNGQGVDNFWENSVFFKKNDI